MTPRLMIGIAAFVVWGSLIGYTLYDIFENGPSMLALFSLIVVGVFGIGIFGALSERRGGPRG